MHDCKSDEALAAPTSWSKTIEGMSHHYQLMI